MFPYRFAGQLHVGCIAGGIPTDPHVAEGWLRSKLGVDKDDLIREMVARTMVDRGVAADEATEIVNANKHLNGFKRERCPTCPTTGAFCDTGTHQMYIEGRQLKSALKEAAAIAVDGGKVKPRGWGKTNTRKGLLSYLAEHVFVVEDRLYLGVTEPSGISQRFVHTYQGSGITYEEYVEDAKIDFTVITDHNFAEKEWAAIWTTGELNGVGAARSQGYGRYQLTRWDRVKAAAS
jgi:hypothetical protein